MLMGLPSVPRGGKVGVGDGLTVGVRVGSDAIDIVTVAGAVGVNVGVGVVEVQAARKTIISIRMENTRNLDLNG
jgi:hypothetical protein